MSKYITTFFDKKFYDSFICHLGEQGENGIENWGYIQLENASPLSLDIWTQVISDEFLIIDARRMNMTLAIVLYARYLKWSQRTFLLLTSEQERAFDWGYGVGICDIDEEEGPKKIARVQRDINFFLSLPKEDTYQENEPVRAFLEKYWGKDGFNANNWNAEILDFDDIDLQEENTGEAIIDRLKIFAMENNHEGFKKELKKVYNNSTIDYTDYIIMGRLCKDMNLTMHRVYILEQGHRKWKDSIPKLEFELIDAYVDSPNKNNREKALKMAENYFGIKWSENNNPILLSGFPKMIIEEDFLKSMFNAYIGLGEFDKLLKLVNFESYFVRPGKEASIKKLFLRNKAVCLREKGEYDKALQLLKKLYKEEATHNTLSLIMITYENLGKVLEAVQLNAIMLLIDYTDINNRIHLAEIMVKYSLIYMGEMKWKRINNMTKSSEKQIIPLLLEIFASEDNQRNYGIVHDIYNALNLFEDVIATNFLLQNKDRIAYIWSKFKKEFKGKSNYDFSLTESLNLMHNKIIEGSLEIRSYIEQILSIE